MISFVRGTNPCSEETRSISYHRHVLGQRSKHSWVTYIFREKHDVLNCHAMYRCCVDMGQPTFRRIAGENWEF